MDTKEQKPLGQYTDKELVDIITDDRDWVEPFLREYIRRVQIRANKYWAERETEIV
jgi:hypothetical protein